MAASSLAVFLARHDVEPSEENVDTVLAGFSELDAHVDVRPALELLRGRGRTGGGAEQRGGRVHP